MAAAHLRLSIVAYPPKGDLADLAQILKGGAEKMHEAAASILADTAWPTTKSSLDMP